MTPLVVVALLTLGFLAGWVGRSVRAAGREWQLIRESQKWAAEAAAAWNGNTDAWDEGWQNGVGIWVDLGEVEP